MVKAWFALLTLLCFHKVVPSLTENETSTGIDTARSCSKGWFSFGEMCYKLFGKKKIRRLPWDQAAEACREEYNGQLATIYSKEIEDFLNAFILLNVKENMWIGLHDRVNDSLYTWDDGTPVTPTSYLNWEPTEPKGYEREDCVEVVIYSTQPGGKTGQWNDVYCDLHYQFICQKEKGKFIKDYADPRFCPVEDGGGWKKNASCYNFIEEAKTWADAEEFCVQNYTGHLVTITDFTVNSFLNYILQVQKKNMWIGIRTKNQFQQQWSSGWYVSYENWAEGEKPAEFEEGSCVARNHEGKWLIDSCDKVLPFICEYSSDEPPVLKPPTEGSSCPTIPADWRDLGGDFCYYFDLVKLVTWYEANFLCMRRGGILASVHSTEEAESFQNFLKFMQNKVYHKWHAIFIGLYRHIPHDDEFVWADGSPLDFTNWEVNEPNTVKEQCVEMKSDNMRWNDIGCAETRGYACVVKKVSSNQTIEKSGNHTIVPTVQSSPCSSGYSASVLTGVVVCVLFVSVFIGVIVFYFCFSEKRYETLKKISGTKVPKYRSEMVVYDDGTYADMI